MKILIKGAGDLATGVAWELFQAGHRIIMTEIAVPLTVRRQVAYSRAVYEGRAEVEGVTGALASTAEEAIALAGQGLIGVLVDPEAAVRQVWRPDVVIDAIMAKKNMGTALTDAALVLALGPGFTAGRDCHAVIETMRGENLGRPLYRGSAIPNTGVPGMVGGYAMERLIKASADGRMEPVAAIGDIVKKGSILAYTGGQPVYAQIAGIIRGMLQAGVPVKAGMKIGDVDPRKDTGLVSLISDKSHKIGRGCAEAIRTLVQKQFGIVVLAAGLSSRYGGNKLLEERISENQICEKMQECGKMSREREMAVQTEEKKAEDLEVSKPLYEITLDKLTQFPDCTRVVVTRFEELETAAKQRGMAAVRNDMPERGISHSLQLGLLACLEQRPCLRGVLFVVCDQPYLRAETMERMLEEGFVHPGSIVCAGYAGKRGNPVLWDSRYFGELLELTGDVGGRQIIKKYPENGCLVECGEKELQDVDIRTEK